MSISLEEAEPSDGIIFKNNEVIFKEGYPAKKLFLIKRGKILCVKKFNDRLIPIYMAEAEDIIGESSILGNVIYNYSAISKTTVELVEIPQDLFHQVFKAAPEWLVDLTATMLSRLQSTANMVAENRLFHPSILAEEDYSSAYEVELNKLLNQ